MKAKLFALWHRYEEAISYLFFGACTTLVNFLIYTACTRTFLPLLLPDVWTVFGRTLEGETLLAAVGNTIAWFGAVAFAYVTNRLFVFRSHTRGAAMLRECLSFYACRILSGVFEILSPSLLIEFLHYNDLVAKVVIAVIVIVLNYVLSKLLIFRRRKTLPPDGEATPPAEE